MVASKNFRALWLAAFVLLGLAHVLHFLEHLDFCYQTAHVHHHHEGDHDHSHDSPPVDPGDAPTGHSHLAEHSHSPAILESAFLMGQCAISRNGLAVMSAAPEAPVWEIEYPPQVS